MHTGGRWSLLQILQCKAGTLHENDETVKDDPTHLGLTGTEVGVAEVAMNPVPRGGQQSIAVLGVDHLEAGTRGTVLQHNRFSQLFIDLKDVSVLLNE